MTCTILQLKGSFFRLYVPRRPPFLHIVSFIGRKLCIGRQQISELPRYNPVSILQRCETRDSIGLYSVLECTRNLLMNEWEWYQVKHILLIVRQSKRFQVLRNIFVFSQLLLKRAAVHLVRMTDHVLTSTSTPLFVCAGTDSLVSLVVKVRDILFPLESFCYRRNMSDK